jgi:hypothetical protein
LKIDGKVCTEDELLAAALTLKDGRGPAVNKHNAVRQELLEWFPVRHLRCLVRPVGDDAILRQLDTLSDDSTLHPLFIRQLSSLMELVSSKLTPKRSGPTGADIVNGPILSGMVKSYVKALNTPGTVPSIIGK